MASLSYIFWKKIRQEMRIEIIAERKPKSKLRLNPKDPSDLNIELQNVRAWSINNEELYTMLLQNGFAEYFCNKQYLYEHYNSLYFIGVGISKIDEDTLKLKNIKYLKLNNNKISILQNIPQNCQQLYLYNNYISQIKFKQKQSFNNLTYLGLGNNFIQNQTLFLFYQHFPQIVCLDIFYNNILLIEQTTKALKKLKRLKVLSLYGNPISLLKHYYKVITKQIPLTYFDEQKYVEQQKKVIKKFIAPIVQQKKQQKKDTKKDAKKDAKKQAKKQQQIPPPVVQVQVQQVIKDMNASVFSINITVLQNIKGYALDSTLYPDFPKKPEKFQSSFWLQYSNGKNIINTQQKRVLYETAAIDQDKARISFNQIIEYQFNPSIQLRNYFSKGITIKIYKQQPILKIDGQNEEKKPELKDGFPITKKQVFGILKIDCSDFLKRQKKQSLKHRLFPENAQLYSEFLYPVENQQKMIQKNKKRLQQELKKIQEELKKQAQLQQSAKNQKKGGKDSKKPPPPDKKAVGVKKGGKQQVQQKSVAITDYPISKRQYIYISDDNIIRSTNMMLSVNLEIK